MKTTKILIAAAAFVSLASLSIAGPGPEYWARMNSKAQTSYPTIWRTKATETKATPAATSAVAAGCTSCQGCQAKKS